MLLQAPSMACSNPWVCATKLSHCNLSCSTLNFCSLKIWKAWPSLAWSLVVTPSCGYYRVYLGRAAKFNPQTFIWLVVAPSPSATTKTAPFGNTKVFMVRAYNIGLALYVPSIMCGAIIPRGHTCNAYIYTLSVPNTIFYSIINSSKASLMTSRTISPMWRRYPLEIFVSFVFSTRLASHGRY